jgi:serine/threonine protein phosphatase PrpC
LLALDILGIWDVMENKVVVDYIRDAVRRGLAPKILAENLITKAISLGSQDNITVTIAFLQYVAQPPSLRTSRKA